MPKKKESFSVEESVAEMLRDLDNRSDYVSRTLERRWQAWISAIEFVRQEGWKGNEVKAVCDACNGLWMVQGGIGLTQLIALEMHDAEQLNGICEKWDISPKRWKELVGHVRSGEALAACLDVLVTEFWNGNTVLEGKLERLGASDGRS